MDELLNFIIENIVGLDGVDVESEEKEGVFEYTIFAPPEKIGILIGKNGKTVRAIRNILRVKSTLEKTPFFLQIKEKGA